MFRTSKLLVATALAASLAACAPADTAAPTGSLRISTSAIVPEVVRVSASLSGPLMPAIMYDLTMAADGTWSTQIDGLAPGALHVEVGALNAAGAELFHGRGDATIVAGSVAQLQIFAQEVAPPPSYGNNPPQIDAIGVSSLNVITGGSVSMNVAAHDIDPGATLTFLWRASDGTFADPASPVAQWTAPATAGTHTIFVTVRDEKGAAAEASFTVTVLDSSALYGNLALTVTLNRAPVVSVVTVAPSRVDVGETTTVTAAVDERDNDAVAVQWTSECPGTFAAPTALTTTFTPMNQPPGILCRLQVYVEDGHGGSATGWSGLWIGPPPPVGSITPPPPPPPGAGFVNGSFETGDYSGWQLLSFPSVSEPFGAGIWGIGISGEVINPGMPVLDYFSGAFVPAMSPLLPFFVQPLEGQFAAFQIPNGLGSYRLFQRIAVQPSASGPGTRAFFLLGANSLAPFRPGVQSIAVNIRGLNDQILATQFVSDAGLPPGPGMIFPVEVDLLPFMGQTIVFDVEIVAQMAPIAVQLDAFQLR